MQAEILVSSFYHFLQFPDAELEQQRASIEDCARAESLQGLVILATEGINGTVAGPTEGVERFVRYLQAQFSIPVSRFKESVAGFQPYKRLKVKLRDEIVTTGDWGSMPSCEKYRHLAPKEWHEMLKCEDVIVLDVRNVYETAIGTFKNAVVPPIKHFSEFANYIRDSAIPKDKKVLMYCTGGIRCEKALHEMERQGYTEVYQLDGGILRYLAEFPNQHFVGECFVFDHRVALDQNLQTTQKLVLCSLCGQPVEKEVVEGRIDADFNPQALQTKLCACYDG